MLGIFDSGFGGLTVLKPIHARLPEISTIYLGDNARAPYGVRTHEEIFEFALEGVRFLFEQGCPLVIFACNTASAQALRQIQQDILPNEYPDRRVLGVIKPAAEHLNIHAKRIGIFATPATVSSNAYPNEIQSETIVQTACAGLTDLIEAGEHDSLLCDQLVHTFVDELLAQNARLDHILLACTHYPLVYELFKKHAPDTINILSQGDLVAESLETYLQRHPEIMKNIDTSGKRIYFTTNGTDVSHLASLFYGDPIDFKHVEI